MNADDSEYYLLPLEDNRVVAVPTQSTGGGELAGLGEDFARSVGPLLATALRKGGLPGAKVYELSPESQRKLAMARTNEVGSYFRGVLRREDGKVSHQVQLREITPANKPTPYEAMAGAQLAAIQAQLGRIEDILNSVALNTERIVKFLEREQRASVLGALSIIAEVHENTLLNGALSGTDWSRLSGTIELEIKKQLGAIGDELEDRFGRASFNTDPKHSIKEMDQLDPQRVSALVELHRVLVGGLRRYLELLLVRKIDEGSFDEHEALSAQARLQELYDRHAGVLERLEAIAELAGGVRPRSNLQRIFHDGIVNGSRNDAKDLAGIEKGRKHLEASAAKSRRTKAIEAPATLDAPALEVTSGDGVQGSA